MDNFRWIPGEWKAICDICGFQFMASELTENWKHQRVCSKDNDRRNPQELQRPKIDEQKVEWTRDTDTVAQLGYKALTITNSPYTIVVGDSVFDVDSSGGAINITLPVASTYSKDTFVFTFTKTDTSSNAITLLRTGSDTIDGATSKALPTVQFAVTKYINGVTKWKRWPS